MQTVNKETTLRYRGTPTRNLRTQQNSPPEKYSPYQLLAFQRAPLGTRLNEEGPSPPRAGNERTAAS
jgi:hypothetical protein